MIDTQGTETIRRRLLADAETLTGSTLPTELAALLEQLGIRLRREIAPDDVRSGGLEKRDGSWWIVLHNSGSLDASALKPRERFTVAHEVGHYLVEARFGHRPTTKREYWSLESLCNEFASHLLLPISAVQEHLDPPPQSAKTLMEVAALIAHEASVSLEASARRIAGLLPVGIAMAAILPPDAACPFGSVGWTAQNRDWLKGGRGHKLAARDPLTQVASQGSSLEPGTTLEITIEGARDAIVTRRPGLIVLSALTRDAA
jgi:hypothetical protein